MAKNEELANQVGTKFKVGDKVYILEEDDGYTPFKGCLTVGTPQNVYSIMLTVGGTWPGRVFYTVGRPNLTDSVEKHESEVYGTEKEARLEAYKANRGYLENLIRKVDEHWGQYKGENI